MNNAFKSFWRAWAWVKCKKSFFSKNPLRFTSWKKLAAVFQGRLSDQWYIYIYFFTEQRWYFIEDSGLHKWVKTPQCTNGRIDQGQWKIANRHRAFTPASRGPPTRKRITESSTAAAWSWVGNGRSQCLKLQLIICSV